MKARNPHTCEHQETEVRAKRIRDGRFQYRAQCLLCGAAVGTNMKKSDAGDNPPAFDEKLQELGRQAWREEYEDAKNRERTEWFEWYNDYLSSPKWHTKRLKVIKRARGLCEGCLEKSAEHVHHLTYANVGDELLFQLVALCASCHEVAHKDTK